MQTLNLRIARGRSKKAFEKCCFSLLVEPMIVEKNFNKNKNIKNAKNDRKLLWTLNKNVIKTKVVTPPSGKLVNTSVYCWSYLSTD